MDDSTVSEDDLQQSYDWDRNQGPHLTQFCAKLMKFGHYLEKVFLFLEYSNFAWQFKTCRYHCI